MQTTIKVRRVTAYGRETFYPNCPLSRKFAALLRQRTLTRENINAIKAMDFTVEVAETPAEQL